jgi:hypothetical protein
MSINSEQALVLFNSVSNYVPTELELAKQDYINIRTLKRSNTKMRQKLHFKKIKLSKIDDDITRKEDIVGKSPFRWMTNSVALLDMKNEYFKSFSDKEKKEFMEYCNDGNEEETLLDILYFCS